MTKTPVTQEEKIIFILLNFLAFETAIKHCSIALPENLDKTSYLYTIISTEKFPQKWDKSSASYSPYSDCELQEYFKCRQSYFNYFDRTPTFMAFCALNKIRDNLIHGNKAEAPDTRERFDYLIGWSVDFINHLLSATDSEGTKHSFVTCAEEIKQKLKIENW